VIKVILEKGDKVRRGTHLIITEAIKMETAIQVPFDEKIKSIHTQNSESIGTGELLAERVK